jgi:hypothetical protein
MLHMLKYAQEWLYLGFCKITSHPVKALRIHETVVQLAILDEMKRYSRPPGVK